MRNSSGGANCCHTADAFYLEERQNSPECWNNCVIEVGRTEAVVQGDRCTSSSLTEGDRGPLRWYSHLEPWRRPPPFLQWGPLSLPYHCLALQLLLQWLLDHHQSWIMFPRLLMIEAKTVKIALWKNYSSNHRQVGSGTEKNLESLNLAHSVFLLTLSFSSPSYQIRPWIMAPFTCKFLPH